MTTNLAFHLQTHNKQNGNGDLAVTEGLLIHKRIEKLAALLEIIITSLVLTLNTQTTSNVNTGMKQHKMHRKGQDYD